MFGFPHIQYSVCFLYSIKYVQNVFWSEKSPSAAGSRLHWAAAGERRERRESWCGASCVLNMPQSTIYPPQNTTCTQYFHQMHFHITNTPKLGNKEERGASWGGTSCSPNTECIRIPCTQHNIPNTHKKNNTHPVTKAWERIGKETKLMWWKLLQVLKFAQKAQFDIYDLTWTNYSVLNIICSPRRYIFIGIQVSLGEI